METFKTVLKVPTKVICFGRNIDEDLQDVKYLILIFPGNPGVVDYYKEFMSEIHRGISEKYPNFIIPVWGISHAGHQRDDLDSQLFPALQDNKHLYSLEGQYNHKFEFTKTYIPSHIKVIGIGHSIGCKTWSELIKKIDLIEKKHQLPEISQCFMLFPTLEKMRDTPNGKWFTSLLPFYIFIEPLFRLIMMMPTAIHTFFLKLYFLGRTVPQNIIDASLQLFNPDVCKRVFHMACCEMEHVWDLDVDTLKRNLDKVFFYFGTTDGWVPLQFVEEMKNKLPGMHYKICDKNYAHAFVVNQSEQMAQIICALIDLHTL